MNIESLHKGKQQVNMITDVEATQIHEPKDDQTTSFSSTKRNVKDASLEDKVETIALIVAQINLEKASLITSTLRQHYVSTYMSYYVCL